MKMLLTSLLVLNIGCTNATSVSTLVDSKPYQEPAPDMLIELHRTVPNQNWDATRWDQLSSEFYSEGEV